jgi:hypothetical protein
MSILNSLMRVFSSKARFKETMSYLDKCDSKLTFYSKKLHGLAMETSEKHDKQMVLIHFFHTASALKLARDEHRKLADAYFSSPRRMLELNPELKNMDKELELLDFLFSSSRHPHPIIERGEKLQKLFRDMIGQNADRYIASKYQELLNELKLAD